MINLSGWKVASCNEKEAKLENEAGHKMTLAMASLSRLQRTALKNLTKREDKPKEGKRTPQKRMHYSGGSPEEVSGGQQGVSSSDDAGLPAVPPAAPAQQTPDDIQVPLPQASTGPGAPQAAFQQGAAQQQQGLAQTADVQRQQATGMVPIEDRAAKASQAQADYLNSVGQDVRGELDSVKGFIQQHDINPRHFEESMTTGKKVTTALGLILGGVAAGKVGSTDNPALKFLNQQIDRDIAAQQQTINNRKTILGGYQQLYGDSIAANAATRISLNDAYLHRAKKLDATLGTLTSAANYNQLAGQKQLENGNLYGVVVNDLVKRGYQPGQGAPQGAPQGQPAGKPSSGIQPILHEGAQDIYNGSQYNPQAKPDYAELQHQFTAAQQADKALQNLGPTFDKLASETTNMQRASQELHNTFGGVPFVGNIPGDVVGNIAHTDTDVRSYDSDRTALVSDLTNALKGANISTEEISKVVNDNLPVKGDTPELLKKKRDAIEGFIKRSVPTSVLNKMGMLNQQ